MTMIRILFGWLLIGQVLLPPPPACSQPRPARAGAAPARLVVPLPNKQGVKNEMTQAARSFLSTLSAQQRQQAVYALDDPERFVWYYTPHDRKGLAFKQMNPAQRRAALALLKTGLSNQGYEKATAIMDLENVLRVLENRPPRDTHRDPDNYYVTVFGNPATENPWSWRVDGHHLSLHFMSLPAAGGRVLAQTPTFFGSNPGLVRNDPGIMDTRMADPRLASLPQYGKQVLKQETERAFLLLQTLTPAQLKRVMVAPVAYPDILTGNQRSVSMEKRDGLPLAEMTPAQRILFLELLQTYLTNYRVTLAKQQFDKLTKGGLDSLRFAWAGDLTPQLGDGKGWYYRIHGPTILIEYDNTQSNANHIHTVVRDLTNDFGADLLREHYRTSNHEKP